MILGLFAQAKADFHSDKSLVHYALFEDELHMKTQIEKLNEAK